MAAAGGKPALQRDARGAVDRQRCRGGLSRRGRRRFVARRRIDGPQEFDLERFCGGLALLIMSALAGEPWHWPSLGSAWAAWLYLIVFGTLIAFSAYMLLLARTSASLAASYSLVNPVVALLLGVTLGGEMVSPWEWLAASVVMLGVVILFVGRRGRA